MGSDLPMPDTAAIVLAGGKSSRMGTAKALLLFDQEPLILHIVRTLRRIFAEIVVVAAPKQELPFLPAITLVHDEVPHQGPVGGMYYGLQATRAEFGFVTSCDVAFVNLSLISHLVSQISDCDVVVPYFEGRLQPLCAVYRKTVLPRLQEQLQRGELRSVSLYEQVEVRKIDEQEIRRFDPHGLSFLNMNTPRDYRNALKRWKNLHLSRKRRG